MDLISAARRSALIGRTSCRETDGGNRISRNFFDGGLHQGIRSNEPFSSLLDATGSTSRLWSRSAAPSAFGGLSRTANWFLRTSMRTTLAVTISRCIRFGSVVGLVRSPRCAARALITAASISKAGTREMEPAGASAPPLKMSFRHVIPIAHPVLGGSVSGPCGDRHRRTAILSANSWTWFASQSDATTAPSAWPGPPQRVRAP